MESKDKVDLALRAAIIAHAALEMITAGSKLQAKFLYAEMADHVNSMADKIKALPED